ncbi:MAG: exodeoxyribonuclease VII small subunit [Clostridia bacterium]|nr:exodeoxyribonuclease VII small subunit [Clostridia bacterium]
MEEQLTFEQRLNQVKEIIEGIEGGQLSLEDSVRQFETGIQALNGLEKELNEMQRRVTVLLSRSDGTTEEKPLEDAP